MAGERLILASGSPRRSALLAALGVDFVVRTSDAEEVLDGPYPEWIVQHNAALKRDDVAKGAGKDEVIIGADTLVFFEEHLLPKPTDLDDARRMLRMLSGNTHQVWTGLAACHTGTGATEETSACTHVTFRDLSEDEIERFVEIVRPVDRAGAYTVDGPGSLIVARYDGCYQNVLGFPMVTLDDLLRRLGVNLFDRMDAGKARFL